tara:strand:+ start:3124 stop:3876 length:753 start_codon:yes stop_codon:yes gene_type:complete
MDNASSYAIANGIRGEVAAIDSVTKGLGKLKGVVDYTLAAAEGISDLSVEIKAKLQELASNALTASQRTQAQEDLKQLVSQGKAFAKQAAKLDQIGGNIVDLFSAGGGGNNITFAANIHVVPGNETVTSNTITVTKAETVTMYRLLGSLALYGNTAAIAQTALTTQFATYETAVADALGTLRQKSAEIENHQEFLGKVRQAKEEVIGAYVDADLATESAKLTALQVQQQLAVQAIGIANQRPQSLLGLFR